MKTLRLSFIVFFAFLSLLIQQAYPAEKTGMIIGKVTDQQSGEPLPGVNVFLKGTQRGAATDLDGSYRIRSVPAGSYSIVVSMIGYSKIEIADVQVRPSDVIKLDFSLNVEIIKGREVVVKVKALKNTGASLLRERQKAAAISDAISAEKMSRSGVTNAAEALRRVTGATTIGGKYVYLRGLGGRYGNTQLNGAELMSADPDKKAVNMDLFPTTLLDNIVAVKTATPDKPANFTGGYIDIHTRDFPDRFTLSFTSSSGYNTNTTFNDRFLIDPAAKKNWLGMQNNASFLPRALTGPDVQIPHIGSAFTNAEQAKKLDQLSRAFTTAMSPSFASAQPNQSYSFAIGNRYTLFGAPIGVLGSLSYNRNYTFYSNGLVGRYQLTGKTDDTSTLTADYRLSDARGTEEVALGGLANITIRPHPDHLLGINVTFNRNTTSSARYLAGRFPRDLSDDAIYESRVLKYVQRELQSGQLRGEHTLSNLLNTQIQWKTFFSRSLQDEPDLRYFTDNYTVRQRNGVTDTLYTIQKSIYPVPTRYFRKLSEQGTDSHLDITLPLKSWNGKTAKLKFGGAMMLKQRAFRERRFEIRQDKIKYDGNPTSFFSRMGLAREYSTSRFYRFFNYIADATQPSSNYDGDKQILSSYVMIDLPLRKKLRLVGGVRFESSTINVASQDSSLPKGALAENDWLPSFNLTYELRRNMNLRFAYGRTLARPTFRELAPYASFDFVNDYIFVGNPMLGRTLTDNLDARWELFSRPGEIYAISTFYKNLRNPIERVINPLAAAANPEVQYRNVGKATVFGAEFELRKRLDPLHRYLSNFQIDFNLSLVQSRVHIAADELALVRATDVQARSYRPLQGQSPFTLNLGLVYDNLKSGTVLGLYYSSFGKRLWEVSIGGTPDIYEFPNHLLDFSFSQKMWKGFFFRLTGKNLLDSKILKAQTYQGKRYTVQQFALGRTFSIGIRYQYH